MSRNSDRLSGGGTSDNQDTSPPQQNIQGQTDDFTFVIPTEFVDLPSKGKYYPENHPLHNAETIEIKQMTAKEEDMLTSRSLLKKGVAIDRVISSLIRDSRVDPETILVGDRNAIVVATRISAYGNIYTTKVTCPACSVQQEYSFDLNDASVYQDTEDAQVFDGLVEQTEDGNFTVELPRSEIQVAFKLLTGLDEKRLASGIESDKKTKGQHEKGVTRQLKNIVLSVNGNTTMKAVNYVVDNMPSIDSRYLRQAYKSVAPNVDLTQHFECSDCDHESEMEVPLTADFFWPDR